jgi:hypothetical protein
MIISYTTQITPSTSLTSLLAVFNRRSWWQLDLVGGNKIYYPQN